MSNASRIAICYNIHFKKRPFLRKGYAYDYYQDKVMKSQSVYETFLHYTNLNVPYVIQWMES